MEVNPAHSLILYQAVSTRLFSVKNENLKGTNNDSRTNESKQDIKWLSYILN